MPVYVALWTTSTVKGGFNDKKDTKKINEVLEEIQQKGGKIIDVKVTLGGQRNVTPAVYLIIYEADKPLYP